MSVLGLDLGLRTGYAVLGGTVTQTEIFAPDGSVVVGTWDCRPLTWESTAGALVRYRAALVEAIVGYTVTLVGYEAVKAPHGRRGGGTQAWRVHLLLQSQLLEVAESRGLAVLAVAPSTLKKFATGSGRAGKPEMVARATEELPALRGLTEDEADAYWTARWAAATVGARL